MRICAETNQSVIQAMYADRSDAEVVVVDCDTDEDSFTTSDGMVASHFMHNADTVF